jgi:hypothetical protein
MPLLQTLIVKLNALTTAAKLLEYKRAIARDPKARIDDLAPLVSDSDLGARFLRVWPRTMQAMLATLIDDNLQRENPLSITWLWKPSHDYELTVWECEDTTVSAGGISVLLGSRYPLETHPVDLGKRPAQLSATTRLAQEFLKKAQKKGTGAKKKGAKAS